MAEQDAVRAGTRQRAATMKGARGHAASPRARPRERRDAEDDSARITWNSEGRALGDREREHDRREAISTSTKRIITGVADAARVPGERPEQSRDQSMALTARAISTTCARRRGSATTRRSRRCRFRGSGPSRSRRLESRMLVKVARAPIDQRPQEAEERRSLRAAGRSVSLRVRRRRPWAHSLSSSS